MRPGRVFIDTIPQEYVHKHTEGMTEIEAALACDLCGSTFRVFAKTNWNEEGCAAFTFEEDKSDVLNRAAAAINKTCSGNAPEGHPKPPRGHAGGVIRLYENGNFGV